MFFLTFHNSSFCAELSANSTSPTWNFSTTPITRSASRISTSSSLPSSSQRRYASMSSANGVVTGLFKTLSQYSIVFFIASRSKNSMPEGVMPATKMAAMARQASSLLLNGISIKTFFCGNPRSLKTIFVMIPSVPSLPQISWVRLYPVEYFNTFAPGQMISPVGKTTSRLST